jgi:hypothetical protein
MKSLIEIIKEILDLNCSYYAKPECLNTEFANYKAFVGTEFHEWVNCSPIQATLVIND